MDTGFMSDSCTDLAIDEPPGLPPRRGRDDGGPPGGGQTSRHPAYVGAGCPRSEDLAKDRAPVSAVSAAWPPVEQRSDPVGEVGVVRVAGCDSRRYAHDSVALI